MQSELKNLSKLEALLSNTGDMALKRRAKNIIKGLDLKNNDKVLDIGCGDGYYLHLLSNLGPKLKLTGTDYDANGLRKARKNIKKGIPLFAGDLMKRLPFKAHTFDKAVMSEVAEHLPNDEKGLKEVHRILKKDGILCLTVPCHNYPLFWDPLNWILETLFNTHIKNGFFAGLWNQHERLYKSSEIENVVKRAGFTIVETKTLTWWCLPFNHYLVNIVARGLAHGVFSERTNTSLSKYNQKPKRPLYLDIAFWFVNSIDRLNDIWQPYNSGVAIYVKAIKK